MAVNITHEYGVQIPGHGVRNSNVWTRHLQRYGIRNISMFRQRVLLLWSSGHSTTVIFDIKGHCEPFFWENLTSTHTTQTIYSTSKPGRRILLLLLFFKLASMHLSTYVLGTAILGSVDVVTAACTSGTWVNLTSIPNPRQEHGTAALGNSTIAVLGGILGGETTDLFQLYDIASGNWSNATAAPYKVNHPNTAAIGSTLYLLGGLTDGPAAAAGINWVAAKESYAYDLATDSWTELSPMPNGTEKGSAVTGVYGDIIYLAGGMTTLSSSQDAVDSVITYNTTSDEWVRLDAGPAELPESRQHGMSVRSSLLSVFLSRFLSGATVPR